MPRTSGHQTSNRKSQPDRRLLFDRRISQRREITRAIDDEERRHSSSRRLAPSRRRGDYGIDRRREGERRCEMRRVRHEGPPGAERRKGDRRVADDRRGMRPTVYVPGVFLRVPWYH